MSAVTIHVPSGWASPSDAVAARPMSDTKGDSAFTPSGTAVPLTFLSARTPTASADVAVAVVRGDSPRSTGSAPKSARESYLSGDVEASVSAHLARKREKERLVATGQGNILEAPELHGDAGYIKSIVYGGLDGIITAFALTASVSGANLAPEIVLVLGFAALFANGVGMGLGDALSEQAEIDFNASERKRERWEMDNHFEGEFDEMLELYRQKGISERDAATVLSIFAKYPDFFLDHMCTEELRLLPPEPNANPWKNGAVTFASFVGFGFVPLIPYLVALGAKSLTANDQFFIAIALTALVLFVLGAVKGYLVDKGAKAWLSSAVTTLVLGSFAAAIAWVVGYALESIVPSDALTSSAGA